MSDMARSTGGEIPGDNVLRRVNETAQNLIVSCGDAVANARLLIIRWSSEKKIKAPRKRRLLKRYLLLSDIILYSTAVAAADADSHVRICEFRFGYFRP